MGHLLFWWLMEVNEVIERSFKRDLKNLLKKYNAELDVSVEMYDFGAAVNGITVYIPESYDNNGNITHEAVNIELTKWVDWESL
jgi:hypothetical protein